MTDGEIWDRFTEVINMVKMLAEVGKNLNTRIVALEKLVAQLKLAEERRSEWEDEQIERID